MSTFAMSRLPMFWRQPPPKLVASVSSSATVHSSGRTSVSTTLAFDSRMMVADRDRPVSVAHRLYPKLPAGTTSYDPSKAAHFLSYDTSKERKLFGIKFHTIEESTKDMLDEFTKRGWISA